MLISWTSRFQHAYKISYTYVVISLNVLSFSIEYYHTLSLEIRKLLKHSTDQRYSSINAR